MRTKQFRARSWRTRNCQAGRASRGRDGTFGEPGGLARQSVRRARLRDRNSISPCGGELVVRALSSERLSGEHVHSDTVGSPVPESRGEQPPVIRRAEVVAFALVGLLVICIVA